MVGATDDLLSSSSGFAFVGSQALGDRQDGRAVEEHREDREVGVLEARDGRLEFPRLTVGRTVSPSAIRRIAAISAGAGSLLSSSPSACAARAAIASAGLAYAV